MKYIYNITYHIEEEVFSQWEAWMDEHLPASFAQSEFTEVKLLQIHTQHVEGRTFSVQYEAESLSAVEHFRKDLEGKYQRELFLKFGEKVLCFATLLEEKSVLKE